MKRFAATAVLSTILSLTAVAQPLTLANLKGTWWGEKGDLALEIGEGGAGTVVECATQGSQAGQFSLDASGKLSFAPQGQPSHEWSASMDGEFLVLDGKESPGARFRRETRDAREERLATTLVAIAEVMRAVETPNNEAGAADKLMARVDELVHRRDVLETSLAGSGRKAQEDLMNRVLGKYAPEALKIMEASKANSRETACRHNLKQIGIYLALFESKHHAYPAKLAALREKGLAEDAAVFRCPASEKDDAYEYVFPADGDKTTADAVIAYDSQAHADGTRCAVTFQGAALSFDEEDFKIALKQGARAAAPVATIDSATVGALKEGREVVVVCTLAQLRPADREGKKSVRATIWLSCYGMEKAPRKSEPISIEGAPGDQPLKVTLRLDLGGMRLKGASLELEYRDENRGREFSETVELTE